ncbi:MAG: glutathione S-transferase [Sneathiellales bacterium]|nr:glutathione S-transferase [Sneathiellales bacterium]
MSNPIKIHGFPLSGHSHRVELFASLADIPFEAITVDLAAGEHKGDAFLKLNPAGQVPTIEDGDVVVSDSNAILVYLARKFAPDWISNDPLEAAEIERFLSLAAGEIRFGPATARLITVFNAPLDADRAAAIAEQAFTLLDQHLEGRDWLALDHPTIADVAVYSYTAHAPEGNVDLAPYKNLTAWISRVEALPGFVAMPATKAGLAA